LPTQAVDAVFAMADERNRAEVLITLAPQLTGNLFQQAVDAVFAMADERNRAEVLITLAPHLDPQMVYFSLESIMGMKSDNLKARVLITFTPVVNDLTTLILTIQESVVIALHKQFRQARREDLLGFISSKGLFAPPIFSQQTLEMITDHIIELCNEWTWL
jgi:hypothetical protein